MPIDAWTDYRTVPNAVEAYRDCRRRCRSAFAEQRETIRRLAEDLAPRCVCCLGAGALNDIPLDAFVGAGADSYLVDWLPGAIDRGLRMSIIGRTEDGLPRCLCCHPGIRDAHDYCENFCRDESSSGPADVCDRFVPIGADPPECEAFDRGSQPVVLCEDVTGGYADGFAHRVTDALKNVDSWDEALRRAIDLARSLMRVGGSLSIPGRSIDFVTSSMLVSQFEHEPYGYFSKQAAARLGVPTADEETRLRASVIELRSTLFLCQVQRHCAEVARMLADGGRCYMSFEMFHGGGEPGSWYVVHDMPRVLQTLSGYFRFDFDRLPAEDSVRRFGDGERSSVVYRYLLRRG